MDPSVCNVIYNRTEIGLPDDPALISAIERISFNSTETSFKLLGILFDEHLNFKPHIDMLCSKSSSSSFTVFNHLPPDITDGQGLLKKTTFLNVNNFLKRYYTVR